MKNRAFVFLIIAAMLGVTVACANSGGRAEDTQSTPTPKIRAEAYVTGGVRSQAQEGSPFDNILYDFLVKCPFLGVDCTGEVQFRLLYIDKNGDLFTEYGAVDMKKYDSVSRVYSGLVRFTVPNDGEVKRVEVDVGEEEFISTP